MDRQTSQSSLPIPPGTRKSGDGGRTSTHVFWGLGGGDVGLECSCLGVTGIIVDVAGGVCAHAGGVVEVSTGTRINEIRLGDSLDALASCKRVSMLLQDGN